MGLFAYVRPDDNVSIDTDNTVWSVNTGTVDPAYPAVNIGDENIGKPAKLTTVAGSWVADLGSAIGIEGFAIFNHNIDAGVTVDVQAHTSDTWGTPSFESTLTIPPIGQDRFVDNPFRKLGAKQTFQFWRLLIGTNSFALAIGEFVLATDVRSFSQNFQVGQTDATQYPFTESVSNFGIPHIVQFGSRLRKLDTQFILKGSQDYTDLVDLHGQTKGRSRAFMVVPDLDANDTWWVRLKGDAITRTRTRPRPLSVIHEFGFDFEEVPSGLTLIDPTQ